MKALVTAGGHGTRLRPITYTQNKHLIPIANKTMLQYALDYLKEAEIYEIGIIINANDKSIQNVFGNGEGFGVEITYIEQDQPLGLAHAVKIAQSFIGSDDYIFYLGDNILIGGVKSFINDFKRMKSNCHLVLSQVPNPSRFGVAEVINDRIVRIKEKPNSPKSNLAVTGIYLYDSNIFEAVNSIKPSKRGELEISDAHQFLIENGYDVSYSEITGWWKDTGKPEDILEANQLILETLEHRIEGVVDQDSRIEGNVIIESGANVERSIIHGPAIIGSGTRLVNAYVGPFTSIMNDVEILNAEIEHSIVLEGTHLNDLDNRVINSLIGKNVRIYREPAKPSAYRFMLGDNSEVGIRW